MTEQYPYTDSFYWHRLKQGDANALGYFYDHYIDLLFGVAIRLTGNRDLAKDCLQEVFIELWNYHASLGDVINTEGYLVKVLRSIVFKKQHKQLVLVSDFDDEEMDQGSNIEEAIVKSDIDKENNNRLQRAFSNLTRRQRQVLELRFYEGLSYDQIAARLSMNYQSVNNLVFRSILCLRRQMILLLTLLYFIAITSSR